MVYDASANKVSKKCIKDKQREIKADSENAYELSKVLDTVKMTTIKDIPTTLE